MDEQHYRPFEHLTVPNSALYRDVMAAFVAAKRRVAVHLRAEDVQETVGAELVAVTGRSPRTGRRGAGAGRPPRRPPPAVTPHLDLLQLHTESASIGTCMRSSTHRA